MFYRVLCLGLVAVAGTIFVSCRLKEPGPSPELQSCQERNQELQQTLDEKEKKLSQATRKRDELSEKLDTLQARLEKAKGPSEKVQQLQQKLSDAEERVAELQTRVKTLEKEVKEAEDQGDAQELREQLNQEKKTRQQVADRLRRTGLVVYESGSYENALPLLHAAQNLGAEDPELLYKLGYCFSRASSYENAAKCYLAAAQKLEENPAQNKELLKKAYLNGGAALVEVGQTSQAINLYEKATKLDDTFAAPYFNLGLIYAQQEDGKEDAIKALRHHIALGGSRAESARQKILELQSSGQQATGTASTGQPDEDSSGQ